jgi:hypothetical protein
MTEFFQQVLKDTVANARDHIEGQPGAIFILPCFHGESKGCSQLYFRILPVQGWREYKTEWGKLVKGFLRESQILSVKGQA